MDFSWLARGVTPVELPDPVQGAMRAMSLQQLSRQNRMGEEEDRYKQLDRQASVIAAQGIAKAQQTGDWKSVITEAAQQGEVGALAARKMLDLRKKDEGDEADIAVKRSTATKNNADADKIGFEKRVKGMNDIANIASEEAKNPSNLSLSRVQSAAKFYGIELPKPAEGDNVPGYLSQLAASAYDIKDRMSNETTRRGQDLTSDTTRRGQDMTSQTAREGRDVTMRGQDMTQATSIRGQDMTNARAKEANGINAGAAVGKRAMDAEMKLADDYRTSSKGWQETAGAISKVNKALDTATTNPGSALAAGTAFMKILDPNSVVRESELGMALNASGWFDRARNIAQTLQSGKVMTPTQVTNLRAAAQDLHAEAAATQRQIDASFTKRTKDYGGDPSRVIVDLGQNKGQGATVKAPDGKTYTFPSEAAAMEFKSKAGML